MSAAERPEPERAAPDAEEHGRHATNLELFLDLVFVFAVTQVAHVLGSGFSAQGFGQGLLLAWLVWWVWSQFTWLGTAVNLADRRSAQFQVLATIPLTLLMAVAIPEAFGATGVQFAGAYLAVSLWALAIQGWSLWRDPETRTAWLRYLPLAALAPFVLFGGAFLDGTARVLVWALVAVFNAASAVVATRGGDTGRTGDWTIDPVHFAERHALFVIISLGEVVVAIGAAATTDALGPLIGVGMIVAAALACVLWWTYFAYVPDVAERVLRAARGADRADVARNMFTFGHFPIVFGLVLYSVAAGHVVTHPADHLDAGDLVSLTGSVAFFVGGLLGLQWQAARHLAPERIVAIIGVGLLCWAVGSWIPGLLLLGAVAVILALMQAISVRRFERLSRSGALTIDDGPRIPR